MCSDERVTDRAEAARELPARLARSLWSAAPGVMVSYDAGDDAAVVEILDAPAVRDVRLGPRLLVQLDGAGPDAMPVTVTVTGVAADPDHPDVARAADLVGDAAWAAVLGLLDGSGGTVEVELTEAGAREQRTVWAGLPGERGWRPRQVAIGVEVRRDVVRASVVDVASLLTGSHAVLDRVAFDLADTAVQSVVTTVCAAVDALVRRTPGPEAAHCPVGVQIGGPVRDGVVRYYYKPRAGGPPTAPWEDVPFAELLRARLGRAEVHVANDAESFAVHEVVLGRNRTGRLAVLVVRHGVGSRLVIDGEVVDIPMEIGTFIPTAYKPLDEEPPEPRSRESIEGRSGIMAILTEIEQLVGRRVPTVREAALIAEREPEFREKILKIFHEAGAGLGRGVAAAQSICSPDRWIVLGPPALTDRSCPTGEAYLRGIEEYRWYLDWPALTKADVVGRPLRDSTGALAASSVAVLRSSGLPGIRRRQVHGERR